VKLRMEVDHKHINSVQRDFTFSLTVDFSEGTRPCGHIHYIQRNQDLC
jgi:hypothetical protein